MHMTCPPVSLAWELLNDCFLDKQSVELEPSCLALACIYIAMESVGRDVATSEPVPNVPTERILPDEGSSESREDLNIPLDETLVHLFGVDREQFLIALELVVRTQKFPDSKCGNSSDIHDACSTEGKTFSQPKK